MIRIAVDIGGTFTDLMIHDGRSDRVHALKTPSTPADPSRGLITGIETAAERFDFAFSDIDRILHGSTIATNAVLEHKLPKGALLTTAGFEDVLEIGRHMRKDVYALKAEPRRLLIPRQLRFGVRERVRADGAVEVALDEAMVAEHARWMSDAGIDCVAIMFLHSYRNPQHELRAQDLLNELAPEISVTTSHETSPEIREFERCSTTVLNALLKPVISRYLDTLRGRLSDAGIVAALYLVQSNGGVVAPEDAARLPAKLLLSGPAGGAMAMAGLAARHGRENLVGIDMGGTSSDVSVLADGRINETAESEIDGLPVRLPMVELRTIGAGGGSIARVQVGGLRVGPDSAGAEPGPVCYGGGGDAVTVTDANLLVGRIDADRFLQGSMRLDVGAARAAMEAGVAADLERPCEQAAEGILMVANGHMAGAIRLSLFEKGLDPADFTLVPFGGAAGLHACAIAEDLGMSEIVFPADASTLSAKGILGADLRWDFSLSDIMIADAAELDRLQNAVTAMRQAAQDKLDAEAVPADRRQVEIVCDLRYRGQAYEIATPWRDVAADGAIDDAALAALKDTFHALHHQRYSHSAPDDPVEIVTVRSVAVGRLGLVQSTPSADAAEIGHMEMRRVTVHGKIVDVPGRSRDSIVAAGKRVAGPLLVSEDYTVLFIAPGWQLAPLGDGDLVATRAARS